jgi:hypothetical protein
MPNEPDYGDTQFEEVLGVYVGEATRAEAVHAIAAHGAIPGAEFIACLTTPGGEVVWTRPCGELTEHISGWTDTTLADSESEERDEDRADVFVFGGGQSEVYFPAHTVFTDVPLVVDLDSRHVPGLERFSGGLRLSFSGATLTLAFWRTASHVDAESGEIAPGLPPFRARLEPDDDEGGES